MDESRKKFLEYLSAQLEEIKRHRWIESEKAGTDLGQHAVADWIQKYARNFRDYWERQNSLKCENQHQQDEKENPKP